MRVVFVNRYVYPDHSATSQMLSDLAGALTAAGVEVVLVGSRQAYDDARADLPPQSTWGGVAIRRVAGTRFGRARLLGRALDYVSFYVAAFVALLGLLRRGDVVVAKTDPPLVALVVGLAVRLRGARLVNWLQDVFPEAALVIGAPRLPGWLARGLVALRNLSLRMAAANVAIGACMASRLQTAVRLSRIVVIPNWAHEATVWPMDSARSLLRRELGLMDHFVAAYSGNLGRAHDSDTIYDAAVALKGRADIVFVVIGGGHEYVRLRERVAAAGLGNVRFLPYQPYERLADSMAVADVHLVLLRPELEGLIVPSKFFSVLAAARPVVYVGADDGELARVIAARRCGIVVRQGDGAGLAAALVDLASDRRRCAAMGQASLTLLRERYAREAAHAAWLALLRDVAGDGTGCSAGER